MKVRHRDNGTGGTAPVRRNFLRDRIRTVAVGTWRKLPTSVGVGGGGGAVQNKEPWAKFLVWMPGRKMMP